MKKSQVIVLTAAILFTSLSSGCVSMKMGSKEISLGKKANELMQVYAGLKNDGEVVKENYSGSYDENGAFHSHRIVSYQVNNTIYQVTLTGWNHPINIKTLDLVDFDPSINRKSFK